jgi:hypothetical protein
MAFTGIPLERWGSAFRAWLGQHAHTGTDGSAVVAGGSVTAGTITDAKLATDVKVGSLAALTTTEKASVVGAVNEVDAHADTAGTNAGTALSNIGTLASLTTPLKTDIVAALNEVDGHADAAYVKPAGGIPASDTATAVQTALTRAGTALVFAGATQGYAANVTLSGVNPTTLTFVPPATAATILGADTAATKSLVPGDTFIVNPDGAGDVTWTVAGAKATSVSNAAPSTDMTQVATAGTSATTGAAPTDMTVYATAGTSAGVAGASEIGRAHV